MTDVEWIRIALNIFRFVVPGEVRLFVAREAAQARSWIAQAGFGTGSAP